MIFELNDEQKLFQRVVREFCEAELKPYAAQADESGEMRWEAIRKMPPLGLTCLQIPEAYGGAALDTISAAIAVEEIGRACGSTGLSISAHNGLGCGPIINWGTHEQKEAYLPTLAQAEALGSLALTEPQAGSDLLNGARTSAQRDGDEWVVNGTKAWITNARFAANIITLVRTDAEAGSRGFSLLIIPTDTEGVTIHPPEKKMGLRASPTHMISFEQVRIPLENVLGEPGEGFYQTMQTLDSGRISIGALSIGLAQAAFEEAIKYARDREAFGKPIAQHQAIQWMLADAAMEIEAARLLVFQAAWLKDQGKPYTKQAAMAKLFASETAERVTKNAIQIHGSYGYSREYPVERIYRDQRLMTIGEGTSEIQRLVIARSILHDADRLR
ncbi:MAG: acyl-CoA dehydrogenase family protein [Anaerolineae bacterium]|nr:acyl-CoA dehydrogenase family protein [Anaerolineae bacterium]